MSRLETSTSRHRQSRVRDFVVTALLAAATVVSLSSIAIVAEAAVPAATSR